MWKNIVNNKFTRLFRSLLKFRYARDIIVFTVLLSGILIWQTKDMLQSDGNVVVNQRNLVSIDNKVAPLLVNDKPNLLYFFAPWCKVCDLSIDNLRFLDEDKINVVVIALDYTSKEEVITFIEKNNVSVQVFLGNENLKSEFAIQGYPSYYLLNEEHYVTSKSFGYSTAIGLKLREIFGT